MASPFPGMNPYVERAMVWHDFTLDSAWAAQFLAPVQ
jgi:hypothetical protein